MNRLPISLRAYVHAGADLKPSRKRYAKPLGPSEWTLVFDTETTTDPSQRLKFGCYQLRLHDDLCEAGLFFDPDAITLTEQDCLRTFATSHNLKCMSVSEFVDDVFYGLAFELRATIVGFNLPFDLSRLAIRYGPARGKMHGGLSFQLSQNPWKPRVQIKHLSSRAALIQFAGTKKRNDTRAMRRKHIAQPVRRGAFVDLKTIAAALTSQPFTLASLADFLKLPTRKAETNDHGNALTPGYLSYAVQDVQVTWEGFKALRDRFTELDLTSTDLNNILSEASLGKAYLKDMGIASWRQQQPEFSASMIGTIMSTYFGGRAEVHIRRVPTRVLYCDFLSMYPTVCALIGLWRFVISTGMDCRDTTIETAAWLASALPADLQKPEHWQRLATLVQIDPKGDIVPVRAQYGGTGATTIGLNHLSSDTPLWFTLADCLASKFLSGQVPRVLKAVTFEPNAPQAGLKPIKVAGHSVDPLNDDFYCELINERTLVKKRMGECQEDQLEQLDSEQQALKILANATSYGIFVEIIVEDLNQAQTRQCEYGGLASKPVTTDKAEKPGTFFHPLLGTLITGAARLMLALTERALLDANLDWAFCDTDSMAIAKPVEMDEAEFLIRAKGVCDWFLPLNPYEHKGPLLKIEDANYKIGSKDIAPLYCLAISSKRYVLFNRQDNGTPIIRKASAHGLGHLTDPYDDADAPSFIPPPSIPLATIGVHRWHYDLWFQIIKAADSDTSTMVDMNYHPALQKPAVSRYAATTPELLKWFKTYNAKLPYSDQVKPFNFLCTFQTDRFSGFANSPAEQSRSNGKHCKADMMRPVAPFFRNGTQAATQCFDRETGQNIDPAMLKTYAQSLAQYHLSPELKFENGDYSDRGLTRRRHIHATEITLIGKEANKWEEQSFLGLSEDANIDYGTSTESEATFEAFVKSIVISQRQLAENAGISRNTARKLKTGTKQQLRQSTITKMAAGIARQAAEIQEMEQLKQQIAAEIQKIGLSEFAKRINCDPANLTKIMCGKRKMSHRAKQSAFNYFS